MSTMRGVMGVEALCYIDSYFHLISGAYGLTETRPHLVHSYIYVSQSFTVFLHLLT